MKITIDTKEDSHDELRKVIKMLSSLVGEEIMSNQSDIFSDSSSNGSSDIFGDDSSSNDSSGDSSSSSEGSGAISNELRKPGHVIPIEAVSGGILERQGHTEAGVELVKLAGIKPAVAVDLEILDQDGNMASREYLFQMAKDFGLKIINIDQIISFVREKT